MRGRMSTTITLLLSAATGALSSAERGGSAGR